MTIHPSFCCISQHRPSNLTSIHGCSWCSNRQAVGCSGTDKPYNLSYSKDDESLVGCRSSRTTQFGGDSAFYGNLFLQPVFHLQWTYPQPQHVLLLLFVQEGGMRLCIPDSELPPRGCVICDQDETSFEFGLDI